MLSVCAHWLYARSMRSGSGARDIASKGSALMLSPRYAGSVTPSRVSVVELRGLANWPAMRPILTMGCPPPYVIVSAICSSTRNVSRTLLTENSSKLSAQSPPISTNPSPSVALASDSCSVRTSPANTRGAHASSSRSTRSSSRSFGYSTSWYTRNFRHDDGDHCATTRSGCIATMLSAGGAPRGVGVTLCGSGVRWRTGPALGPRSPTTTASRPGARAARTRLRWRRGMTRRP
mmetsp:Transcript_13202/g.52910  ORF Transcript_13202/g.52910 Transcript_13202/m.52910 type:complete len:234 (-) Transcript_13202:87-788(-)